MPPMEDDSHSHGRCENDAVNRSIQLRWPQVSSVAVDRRVGLTLDVHTTEPGLKPEGQAGLVVQGDAEASLGAILADDGLGPRYRNKVQLCYVDPPFNRGDRFGQYDDTLGRAEWLSMLRGSLQQSKQFLTETGSIWVHLDDAAQHHGRCLLDEVFGEDAFVATVIWQRRTTRDNRKAFSAMHDYIHVYAPCGPKRWKQVRNPLPDLGSFSNPDNDPRGPWRSVPMTVQAGHATKSQFYTVETPAGSRHDPPPGRCWTFTKDRLEQLIAAERVYWPRNGHGKPRLKRFRHEVEGVAPFTIWPAEDVGNTSTAKKEILALVSGLPRFDTPKPERLLERIISVGSDPGDLVLDFFLGSGTTAAVAQKMGRQWVGIDLSQTTLETCTLPRLKKVVAGTDGIGITRYPESMANGFEVARLSTTSATGIEDGSELESA